MTDTKALRLYRPSNGSEGDWFRGQFCDRCVRDRDWRESETNPCEILNATLCLSTDDPHYPSEWRYDENDDPVCMAFDRDPSVPNPEPLTPEEIQAIDAEAQRIAFEMLALAHPDAAYAEWPERFWSFFQRQCPGVSREEMERRLAKAAELLTEEP